MDMQCDFVHTPANHFVAWLETNGAVWCHRLNATITADACLSNMYMSERKSSDLRCAGCGGLDNQPGPGRSFLPPVMIEEPESEESPAGILEEIHHGSAAINNLNDGFAALDEIIARHFENPAPADDFDDVEFDLDDETLLALFPELYEGDDDAYYPSFTAYQTPMPRYAVYKGRCKRCGGYMNNFRERHDDNAFRCLACGWRTSPEYEQNRMLLTSGMNG
jgi:hypothetical protein